MADGNRTLVERLPGRRQPGETIFFLVVGLWGAGLGLIYAIVAAEAVGIVLLLGLGGACLFIAVRLILAHGQVRAAGRPAPAPGADKSERPFLDEEGRLPNDTVAPLGVGIGIALAALGVVYGPGLVVAGVVPFAWGAVAWITDARHELDALEAVGRSAPVVGEGGEDRMPRG